MQYTKKFWAENNRYKKGSKAFNNYVGILDGQAYDYYTGAHLEPSSNTYLTDLYAASKDFNRNLNEKLKLPFLKEDILLAPNDFLYSSTLNDIISKLQKNNEYIYQNCTISNGQLNTELTGQTVSLVSNNISDKYIVADNKTISYEIQNKDGSWSDTASPQIATIPARKLVRNEKASSSEWSKLHNGCTLQYNDCIDGLTNKNIQTLKSKSFTTSKEVQTEYTSNEISGKKIKAAIFNPFKNFDSENIAFLESFENSSGYVYIHVDSFSFITSEFVGLGLAKTTTGSDNDKDSWWSLQDDAQDDRNASWYLSQEPIKVNESTTYYLNTIYYKMIGGSGTVGVAIPTENIKNFTIGIGTTILTQKFEYLPNSFIMNYRIADNNMGLNHYAEIRDVIKERKYQFKWTDGNTSHLAPVHITFGSLKNTSEWIDGGENSKLVYSSSGESLFVPSDDMTAKDVYIAIKKPHLTYDAYPTIGMGSVTYKDGGIKTNPYYKPRHYPITTLVCENNILRRGYKTAETIAKELQWGSKNSYPSGLKIQEKIFNDLPIIREVVTINENTENYDINYNIIKINAAELVFSDNVYTAFIAFNDKVLIVKDFQNNFNKIFDNLNNGSLSGYKIIDSVSTGDVAFRFSNIKSMRVSDGYLYLVDSKLNAVFQYDVTDTIGRPFAEPVLVNYLEGDGSAKDKLYFNKPNSVAVSKNRVYIADSGNKCIKIYTRNLNYVKTLKNAKYASFNIHSININPSPLYLFNDVKVEADSLWVISEMGNKLYLSIYSSEHLVYHGKIENILLEQDEQLWQDEVRNIVFSHSCSSHYYIATSRHLYKLYTSRPLTPIGSIEFDSSFNEIKDPVDHRCFAVSGNEKENGDQILDIFLQYDYNKLLDVLGEKTFNDLSISDKVQSVREKDKKKYIAIAFFKEIDKLFTTLSNLDLRSEILDTIVRDDDYINALTFNKMIYPLIFNLYSLKNGIFGVLKTVAFGDNNVANDGIEMDNYFYELDFDNQKNLLMHTNESLSISINRIFESILDLQIKIINHMQSKHLSSSSLSNNGPKLI